jgi:hypothetical protein
LKPIVPRFALIGRGADNERDMEIVALIFILLVGPLAVLYGADSRR